MAKLQLTRAQWWVGAALLLAPPIGMAHASLAASEPAANAVLVRTPPVLRLRFSEVLEPAFSTVSLRNARGDLLELGKPALDAADAHVLSAPVPKLASGSYQVRWSAASHDGHRTRGMFSFEIK